MNFLPLAFLLALALAFTDDLAPIENSVLLWLNTVRTNPTSLIPYIQQQLSLFQGNFIPLTPTFNYQTKEGSAAWLEAIAYLQVQPPLPTLQEHPGLDQAALVHALDLKQQNNISHTGSDGSLPADRINRSCVYTVGSISEDIAEEFLLESRDHGRETIISLIVDDGVPDRGHRLSLLSPLYKYVGLSTQKKHRLLHHSDRTLLHELGIEEQLDKHNKHSNHGKLVKHHSDDKHDNNNQHQEHNEHQQHCSKHNKQHWGSPHFPDKLVPSFLESKQLRLTLNQS